MTISQTSFLSEILSGGEASLTGSVIPAGQRGYFQERLKGRVYSLIVGAFLKQQKLNPNLTQKDIAKRLDKRPEQINRWLSGPSNWTLETISDLLLAISGAEPSLGVSPLRAETRNQTLSERHGDGNTATLSDTLSEPPISEALRKAGERPPEDQMKNVRSWPSSLPKPQGIPLIDSNIGQQRQLQPANNNDALARQAALGSA
jgi:transcriptional regulator with XRE-family HTH domain